MKKSLKSIGCSSVYFDVLPWGRSVGVPWSRDYFVEHFTGLSSIVGAAAPIEIVRSVLLQYLAGKEQLVDDDPADQARLDRIVVRDCVSAFRSMLQPRSERLSGYAFLECLNSAVRSAGRADLSPGFWAEICHLAAGLEGQVRMHSSDSAIPTEVSGREAAEIRSGHLDNLSELVATGIRRFRTGLDPEAVFQREGVAARIMSLMGAGPEQWNDWKWQTRNAVSDQEVIRGLVALTDEEKESLKMAAAAGVPLAQTPYYLSLFDDDPADGFDLAVRAQVLPPKEYAESVVASQGRGTDFMREEDTSPVDMITRRYASICILKPCLTCPQICVYCQRNWQVSGPDGNCRVSENEQFEESLEWIRRHPGIREVLVTGGDPLMLEDDEIRRILDGLSGLKHIERIRVGSRVLVTMPMRFTDELCDLLSSYRVPGRRDVSVVTHFQHVYEITPSVVSAVDRIRRRGLSIYNQHVYTFYSSRRFENAALRRLLKLVGIDPYYTFNPKGKDETLPYRVPIVRLLQERKEEARLLPGLERTDESVFNVPGLGKNYLNYLQHRDLVSILPDGSRCYEFHPWEKNLVDQRTWIAVDVPIFDYLKRLESIGESSADYESIWYYF